MATLDEVEQKKLQIALAFHDLGLFTDKEQLAWLKSHPANPFPIFTF